MSAILGDNVKKIEKWAFHGYCALRFILLSKTLECIEIKAFVHCYSFFGGFVPPIDTQSDSIVCILLLSII